MKADEVWAFTVEMYGREGVAPLCLELQDRCGLDVNMMLFMFFLGRQGLAPHSISALETAVADWREAVIIPLRHARRYMRQTTWPSAQHLRDRVKADELEAEKIEQQLLCAAVETVPAQYPMSAARAYLSPTRFDLTQDECDRAFERLCALMAIA